MDLALTTALKQLARFLTDAGMPTDVGAVSREHVEAFITDQLERLSPASAANRYSSLRPFFNWLVEEGEIKASPMARMRKPKVPEHAPPILTDVELAAVLRACEGPSFDERRDAALVRVFLSTGGRLSEVANLRWTPEVPETNDVDLDAGVMRVMGKGRRERMAFLSQPRRAVLVTPESESNSHVRDAALSGIADAVSPRKGIAHKESPMPHETNTGRTDIWSYRDAQWQSDRDLTGYKVEAIDGEIGSIDEASSEVGGSYVVVDTGPWIFGKKVLLPAGVIQAVNVEDERVMVNRTKDQIENAPEFDEDRYRDEMYRSDVGTYYDEGGRGYRDW